MGVKAAFIDRDGVINEDRDDYVKGVAELRVFQFTPDAIRILNEVGYQVFVISNQQGIAKGLYTEDDLADMQIEIVRQVEEAGGKISGFYYCKHLASDNCSCRKPKPGLILQAAQEHDIDLGSSVMIGDSERDIIAGRSAGCRTALVLTGKLAAEEANNLACTPNIMANNLLEAAEKIVGLSI